MYQYHRQVVLLIFALAALPSCKKSATDQPTAAGQVIEETEESSSATSIDAAPGQSADTDTQYCAAGGRATLAGTVGENDVDVAGLTSAWFVEPKPGLMAIALQEEGLSCGLNESLTVALMFCSRDAKTYTVMPAPETGPDCATKPSHAYVLAEGKDGIDIGLGTKGTLTIEHGSQDCLAGTFDFEIADKPIRGSFEAVFCEDAKGLHYPE